MKKAEKVEQPESFDGVTPSEIARDLQFEDLAAIDFTETADANAKKPARADAATGMAGNLPRFRRRTEARIMLDLSQIRNAAGKIGKLPRNEETLHAITGGDHTGWDLVPAIHSILKRPIDELWISTLGFSTSNIAALCEMFDRREIKRASILAGDFFAKGSAPFFNYAIAEFAKRKGLQLRAMRNHSKIVLIAAGAQRYVIETSANLRSCNNLEQFTLTRSRPLFEFHRKWIDRVLKFGA